jgi:[protein-PII] uridylyltransferase
MDRSLQGRSWNERYTQAVDEWIRSLFGEQSRYALLALGSYGRQELCPHSDIDLMLVHARSESLQRVEAVANGIWYPIWDLGLGLDHSVKTPRQALEVATDDVRALLGLLDARVIAGNASLGQEATGLVRSYFAKRFRAVSTAIEAYLMPRFRDFGELAHVLEPNLKECDGGLRDLHILESILEVAELPGIPPREEIAEAGELLLTLRVELHRLSERPSDRLGLDEQDIIAPTLGFHDAEALMKEVAHAGRVVSYGMHQALRVLDGTNGNSSRTGDERETVSGFYGARYPTSVSFGTVGFDGPIEGKIDALAVVRLAHRCAREGLQLRWGGEQLAERLLAPPVPWPEELREEFIGLLQAGDGLYEVIEALDGNGVMEIFIPEWSEVRCKPQRNAFHRYSVDRHLVGAVVEASSIRRRVHRPDLLVVAALLHDIGKGRPGDHTDNGVVMARSVMARMGFDDRDRSVIERLVSEHLLLAETALRRDISDPSAIQLVAERVGDPETLELLAALTEADSKATGVLAWSAWKESLIEELCRRANAYLQSGEVPAPAVQIEEAFERQLLEAGAKGMAIAAKDGFVYVAAPDRPGLFALVAGAMSLSGISIVSAEVFAKAGVAIERYRVTSSHGGEVNLDRLDAELKKARVEPDEIAGRLAERAAQLRSRRRSAPRGEELPPRVVISNTESARATIVEVWAPNRIGLLHEVTAIFASMELDIGFAKVMTRGDDVIDSFYLTDRSGAQIEDPAILDSLHHAVLEVADTRPKS